jgi:tetratricopeptide (TPR) repeat protein
MNSFASFWVVRGANQHVYAGLRLGAENKLDAARAEASQAVESDPSSAKAQRFLAFMLNENGRTAEALGHAQRAVELKPTDGSCHLQLGMVLAQQNQLEPAVNETRRALELIPEDISAYTLLQSYLSRLGRTDEAIGAARDALALYPYDAQLHHSLAVGLAQKQDLATAIKHFVYALLLWPSFPEAHTNFRLALTDIAKTSDGASHLREITSMGSESPAVLDEMAWFYATDPDPALRDGKEAIQLAERACALSFRAPKTLATLAAAYAENARLPEAIKAAEEARAGAQFSGDSETLKLTGKLLASFRGGQPFREMASQK